MAEGNVSGREATVFDFGHFRNTDGAGIRTMIFFKGCPLRCKWCSNPWGLSVAPQLAVNRERCVGCGACVRVCKQQVNSIGEDGRVEMDWERCSACGLCVAICPASCRKIAGERYDAQGLYEQVRRDLTFTRRGRSGITLSGGEVLMQWEVAAEVLRLCKRDYIDTCIETSAFGPWEHLEALAAYCDTAFVDLKHMDSARHREVTGAPNELILENIECLCAYMEQRGRRVIVRHPVIPGYTDDESNAEAIARFMAQLPGKPDLNILPYHNLGELKYTMIGEECEVTGLDMMKKTDERIGRIVEACERLAPQVRVTVGGENIHWD
ncbi:glycyl-radical enzyme activating protein [Collinsella sp. An271]|uniref:glycyl-radical enzyme activating protein n=1 Tax=Collinsella sp. An271 TaxID=1965616 RepID=UPI0013025942|nr:glycyl-radical enzyme activating protein [Collinsella sp. An271]